MTRAEREFELDCPVKIIDESKAPKASQYVRIRKEGYLAGYKRRGELVYAGLAKLSGEADEMHSALIDAFEAIEMNSSLDKE